VETRRLSVSELKQGLNFNEIINLDGTKGVNPSPGSLESQTIAPKVVEVEPQSQEAQNAVLAAKSRYYGRKAPKAAASLRDQSQSLTEEEKIGQLKKIKKAAEDYEGLLMKEMIKSVRQSPLVKTAGSETYSEIAEKPFTAALTAAGGLGLAEKIVSDVARQEGLTDTLKAHPEIMGPNYRPKISPNLTRKAPLIPSLKTAS
jgi:hypothetical protein